MMLILVVYITISVLLLHAAADTKSQQSLVSQFQESQDELRPGIVFLNLGGPEKLEDVRGFLYNLFADPDIIRLPFFLSFLQKPLAYFIAKKRAPKSALAYARIGGGSPINNFTTAQVSLVERQLHDLGYSNVKCYFAMRYWRPYFDEVIQQVSADQRNALVFFPLYPHYSVSTTGSSLKEVDKFLQSASKKRKLFGRAEIAHTTIPLWFQQPKYIRALTALLLGEVFSFSREERQEGIHVLFSAHGVPVKYVQEGDPYQEHIEETFALVQQEAARQLPHSPSSPSSEEECPLIVAYSSQQLEQCSADWAWLRFHLSYQSRVGPVEWLRPYTDERIVQLATEGVRNLLVVPVSFVSDHIETLEEMDHEYHELALHSGIAHWRRCPALNTDPLFVSALTDLAVRALHDPVLSVSETLLRHQKSGRALQASQR